MKLRDLFQGLEVELPARAEDVSVTGLVEDSREAAPGVLFVCVRGLVTDGHLFAAQAVERGATVLVVEERLDLPPDVLQIKLSDTREILPVLARNFYGRPDESMKFVGVTGTNGKTTVTHLIAHVLEGLGEGVALVGTVAYRMGDKVLKADRTTPPPLLLWKLFREALDKGIGNVVMEVSSHALALGRVEGIQFDVSAFTNLSRDHLDFHETMEHYYWSKKTFFTHYTKGVSVVNMEDPYGRRLASAVTENVVGYGMQNGVHFRGEVLSMGMDGLNMMVEEPRGDFTLRVSLVGRHNAYNVLAAWAVLAQLGADADKVCELFQSFSGVKGRLEKIENSGEVGVFVDYAHTPDALEAVLASLRPITKGKLVLVFGCGGDRDRGKRSLMGKVASSGADRIVVTSDNPRGEEPMAIIQDILLGMEGEVLVEPGREKAIRLALESSRPGDVVLIAGKGHEDYQIVGGEVFPFSDAEVARMVLEELGWA